MRFCNARVERPLWSFLSLCIWLDCDEVKEAEGRVLDASDACFCSIWGAEVFSVLGGDDAKLVRVACALPNLSVVRERMCGV
jgi:hypothetical protein